MIHSDVRALAKSDGLVDDQEYIKKNYILNNMKNVVKLAHKKQPKEKVGQMMIEDHLCSQFCYIINTINTTKI